MESKGKFVPDPGWWRMAHRSSIFGGFECSFKPFKVASLQDEKSTYLC